MRLILIVSFIVVVSHSQCQQLFFKYLKKDELRILSSDSCVYIFGPYEKSSTSLKESNIRVSNGHSYRFSVEKTEKGDVQQLRDSTGTIVATVLLIKDDRYSLVLQDGTKLKYGYKDDRWWYQNNGMDAMRGKVLYSGNADVTIECLDSLSCMNEIVIISFLERGSFMARAKQFDSAKAAMTLIKMLSLFR